MRCERLLTSVSPLSSIGINRFSMVEYSQVQPDAGYMGAEMIKIYHPKFFYFGQMSNFDRKIQSFYYELNVDSNSTPRVILDHLMDKIRLDELDNQDHAKLIEDWKKNNCLSLKDNESDKSDKSLDDPMSCIKNNTFVLNLKTYVVIETKKREEGDFKSKYRFVKKELLTG